MKQTVKGTLFVIELNELDSSFISSIIYDAKAETLSVLLKNENVYNYKDVPLETFVEFSTCNSFGSFYNSNIKNKFKHVIMADNGKANKPNKINKAGDHKRYIKMSLDLKKVNKDWLYITKDDEGEIKAIYLKCTLCMLPDGTVDKYGQLGFVAQEVPVDVLKDAPVNAKPRGEILGNGEELEWTKRDEDVAQVVTAEDKDELDDLPF